jgi:enoyl-CoA hydratase/carnithine racemase
MTSAPSPTSPLVSASLHEDDTLLRIVLDRPKAIPPVLAAIGALRLGGPLADRLLLTGSTIDAGAAERAGLVASVFSGGNPYEECLEWYRKNLRPLSAFAIRQVLGAAQSCSGIREALGQPLATVERQYLDHILTSRDGNEGISAYLERRKPVWEDR